MLTIDSQWVLFPATALGATGAWLLMPPGKTGRRAVGAALTAAALTLWASQLPRLGNWLDDGLLCLSAILAVVAALATITARAPAFYLSAFAMTALGTVGLMLLAGAYLPAATVAVVHAGLIPLGLWLMLRRAGRSGSTPCDRPSREPLLCATAGMVTVGVLWGLFAGVLGERGADHQTALLHNGLAVGTLLLGVGLIGLLGRRETVVMLLASQVMLLGVSLSLVALGRFHDDASAGALAVSVAVAVALICAGGISPGVQRVWSWIAVAGLMLVAVADDLVPLFIGMELTLLSTCVATYFGRRDTASPTAAAKCFFPGLLASVLFAYGLALLYGSTGSTGLATIRATLADADAPVAHLYPLVKTAVTLIVVALGFRIAAVGFRFRARDVHCRTPHGGATSASVVITVAALLGLVRILMAAAPQSQPDAWRVTLVAALLMMTVGNVSALRQNNLHRLLVHASIAQGGYMLLALSTITTAEPTPDAAAAMLVYLGTYAMAMIGTLATLVYLGRRDRRLEVVEELAGLGRSRPLPAAALALFAVSLIGIPPAAGFWGKLAVMQDTFDLACGSGDDLRSWFVAAAVIGTVNLVVAAVYHLRIVAVMYLRMPLGIPKAEGGPAAALTAGVCAALTILIGLIHGPFINACDRAAENMADTAVAGSQNPGQELDE